MGQELLGKRFGIYDRDTDLKTEKNETPTSIHLINVAHTPLQILHCFPFSSALQRKEQTLQTHNSWAALPFFLCYSSWPPVIIVVFSSVAQLRQTARKATWKVHHVHNEIQVWHSGGHIGMITYVLLEPSDFLPKQHIYKAFFVKQFYHNTGFGFLPHF